MATVVEKDDQIIVLASSSSGIKPCQNLQPAPKYHDISDFQISPQADETFLFLGWSPDCIYMLKALASYTQKHSRVRIICEDISQLSSGEFEKIPIEITVEQGNIFDKKTLSDIDWQFYENIVIPGYGPGNDMLVARMYILLKDALADRGFINNITVVFDNLLRNIAEEISGVNIVSVDIIFRIAAQILAHPDVMYAILEMISPEGVEVYLKPVENYIVLEREVDFFTIIESARRYNETAIGYITEQTSKISLNPPKFEKKRFYHFDKIIVFSDHL
ncbi:hypothetical protein K7I13_07575 [Brucepastera parasyntrophica]|uniref:hypothetical protein n=1 Tax=Brucepastera parasyntrophica TaxID=2880008 RepID=UPI00210DCC5E|nr:hypothetical protein [Brucepastera parasyntrophica]ULQ61102.1 hypothetical protein K7I13_07575 [Brucepastera parasyntrophica]